VVLWSRISLVLQLTPSAHRAFEVKPCERSAYNGDFDQRDNGVCLEGCPPVSREEARRAPTPKSAAALHVCKSQSVSVHLPWQSDWTDKDPAAAAAAVGGAVTPLHDVQSGCSWAMQRPASLVVGALEEEGRAAVGGSLGKGLRRRVWHSFR
jgi:hypothetical protein